MTGTDGLVAYTVASLYSEKVGRLMQSPLGQDDLMRAFPQLVAFAAAIDTARKIDHAFGQLDYAPILSRCLVTLEFFNSMEISAKQLVGHDPEVAAEIEALMVSVSAALRGLKPMRDDSP